MTQAADSSGASGGSERPAVPAPARSDADEERCSGTSAAGARVTDPDCTLAGAAAAQGPGPAAAARGNAGPSGGAVSTAAAPFDPELVLAQVRSTA